MSTHLGERAPAAPAKSEDNRDAWQQVGPHLYRFEPPDLFHLRCLGDVSEQEIEKIMAVGLGIGERAGSLFWLNDIGKLGALASSARKRLASTPLGFYPGATAVFGGSFQQRVLANIAIKASRILRPWARARPIAFCADEAEARAFFEEVRRDKRAPR
jgi:hypothetical protein